ncbi:MAG: S1 RNA-binding domain-containing protein [Chloroflexi bacterium]|nr:S1 RNA-binding domain-containing protein [Chloroflexota bacterium]
MTMPSQDPSTLEPMGEEGRPEEQESMTMEELLQQEENLTGKLRRGEIVEGVVSTVGEQGVWISLGGKTDGLIPAEALEGLSEEERAQLREGNKIRVFVEDFDSNGTPRLSYRQALEMEDWERAKEYKEKGLTYRGKIVRYNRGGVVVQFGRLQGFIPTSHILRSRRMMWGSAVSSPSWEKAIGDEIVAKVIEVDPRRRRLILSERAAAREARELLKDKLLEKIKVGDVLTGRVTRITPFGAFVDIGGADGLVHISEISWEHIKRPEDVLEEGQEVKVKVIEVDPERRRIGLSIRQTQEDPWKVKTKSLRVGQLVRGVITRLEKYGAFARLENGLEGLIHISEISHRRIEHPKEVLHEGEEVTLRIIRIEPERRRIGLSIKKVDSLAYADLDLQMALQEAEAEMAGMAEGASSESEAEAEAASVAEVTEAAGEADASAAQAGEAETQPEAKEAEA